MAHRTLIGGTAYNITGGRSMVSGTAYNISGGRTMVGGTGYNIGFGSAETDEPTAMLYSDGNFVFQYGDKVESGKTLTASYTGFENVTAAPPWNGKQNMFKNVKFYNEITPISMYYWFYGAENMQANISSFYLLNMSKVTRMNDAYTYCSNLTGSPVCGNNVTDMYRTYYNCANIGANAYFYSSNVSNSVNCFKYKNNSKYLNIYVPANSITNNTVHYNNTRSLVGANITWKNAGTYQYNTTYNIYIYPVANVAAAAIANGDEEANANAGITV